MADLESSGVTVAVFGGWAEELVGLTPPRLHRDIDLPSVDADLDVLDAFVASRSEVRAKR